MKVLVLLALASLVQGIKYDGLRVKFGWSDALADVEYFFKLPRTQRDAETEGWTRMERPKGYLPELKMYCPPLQYAVCTLYDTNGCVTGLQIALPVEDYESSFIKPEQKFVKWSVPATKGVPAKEYWTATQYLASEESMKAGAGPQVENGETLQDGGVWVAGHDKNLLRIPATEAELNTTIFKRQNCIPNMGTHYYYNMTKDMNCENILPWFALTSGEDLIGTGFQMVGSLKKQPIREWFEIFTGGIRMAAPYAPQCLEDWVNVNGLVSLHIYYIDKPWTIGCKAGDSVAPAPTMDRLKMNGYRYASKISDEVKKIFSG